MNCAVCFADANAEKFEPDIEHIGRMYAAALGSNRFCSVQLSGGEPTVRDDLPEIIKLGKDMGVVHLQVNTNGIKPKPSEFYYKLAEGEVQERRPVEQVSWYDAIVYCNLLSIKEGLTPCYTIKGSTDPAAWGTSPRLTSAEDYDDWKSVTCNFDADGYRLPTEAEWEYAARGGNPEDGSWDNTYSGSNTLDDVAWYRDNSDRKTHEVGKKQANALGLYDMSGNVLEWCWDWYGSSSGYPSGTEDPAGPDAGSNRVGRGGSWRNSASDCTASNRSNVSPYNRYNDGGFRLVRSAQ